MLSSRPPAGGWRITATARWRFWDLLSIIYGAHAESVSAVHALAERDKQGGVAVRRKNTAMVLTGMGPLEGSGVHAELVFVDPTTSLANITEQVRFVLERDYIFRSESEGQPPLNVPITRGAFAITGISYSAPRLSLDKQAAVLKDLTIELVLPFPKGLVPLLDILLDL